MVHSNTGKRPDGDCVFRVPVSEEVDGVAFAECLTTAVGRAESDRQASPSSENRRERPAPEQMAD